MPTIITAHMAKANKTSAAVHGMSIVIPIAAIALSYSMSDRHPTIEMDEIGPG